MQFCDTKRHGDDELNAVVAFFARRRIIVVANIKALMAAVARCGGGRCRFGVVPRLDATGQHAYFPPVISSRSTTSVVYGAVAG
jgi:hypothetical protein